MKWRSEVWDFFERHPLTAEPRYVQHRWDAPHAGAPGGAGTRDAPAAFVSPLFDFSGAAAGA